jgi:hypothetical protein
MTKQEMESLALESTILESTINVEGVEWQKCVFSDGGYYTCVAIAPYASLEERAYGLEKARRLLREAKNPFSVSFFHPGVSDNG